MSTSTIDRNSPWTTAGAAWIHTLGFMSASDNPAVRAELVDALSSAALSYGAMPERWAESFYTAPLWAMPLPGGDGQW